MTLRVKTCTKLKLGQIQLGSITVSIDVDILVDLMYTVSEAKVEIPLLMVG